jgi:hypothetical protein
MIQLLVQLTLFACEIADQAQQLKIQINSILEVAYNHINASRQLDPLGKKKEMGSLERKFEQSLSFCTALIAPSRQSIFK